MVTDLFDDVDEKDIVASTILQRAINLATQTIINLDIGSLLVMKINKLSSPHLKVWSHDSSLCFFTVQNHTIQAGQILSLHLEAISNFPSAPTDIIYHLQDDLPIYFNF